MPTQEELNAAQVELDIANDNYAQLADRYNKYKKLFETYANATPEQQARAAGVMRQAIDEYNQIRLNMYTAEDRIQQAQNRVNNYNSIINQPAQPQVQRVQRRPITPTQTPTPTTAQNNTTYIAPTQRVINSNYVPNQNMLRINWVNTQQATISPAPTIPYEIQNVRNLRWNDYLQWLKNLEDNYWYNVIWQRAYRNWESYRTY